MCNITTQNKNPLKRISMMFRHALCITSSTAFKRISLTNPAKRTGNPFIQNHWQIRKMSLQTGKPVVIGTHSGLFHCDEILAIFLLQQLPQYKNVKIVRTRDDATLNECDIVVDVGSVYDPAKYRFDHHQQSFQHTLGSLRPEFAEKFSKVRLSSAGLIYAHFGEEVIRQMLKKTCDGHVTDALVKLLFEKIYESFIQEIDGIDNGVSQFPAEPIYQINTHLSARVGRFNAQWNSAEEFNEMEQFEKGKQLVGEEFTDKVLYYANVWWPARSIVADALKKRFDLHSSGKIIELAEFCPWKQHFFGLEEKANCVGEVLYCIGESGPGDYRIICVPVNPNSFQCRKFLPKPWRGIRDADLVRVSGITGAGFCHANGFIGGAKSRDDTLQMAIKAVEFTENESV